MSISGVIRYRENEDTGRYEMYDARCAYCVDFTPNWVESAGAGWVAGDREAVQGDAHIVCEYRHNPVFEADEQDNEPTVQYAEGFTFVSVYEVDRLYGGPEEGGWYYDAGQLIECRQVVREDAGRVCEELKAKYPKTGDSSSVLYCGGDYRVWCETEPGRDFPEYTPHYE